MDNLTAERGGVAARIYESPYGEPEALRLASGKAAVELSAEPDIAIADQIEEIHN
jgi:hypothetical protein